jgi:Do/DeqQ family serine protease
MKSRMLVGCTCGLILALSGAAASAQFPFLGGNGNDKPTLAPLLKEVTPAVVSISVESQAQVMTNPLFNDPLFDRFFGSQPQAQPEIVPRRGAGSGVIIDADDGYVLTNNHVISGADRVTVSLSDGRQFEAEVIGSDEGTDIGLVKIDAGGLTALKLGDSDSLEVGDFVLAIGNPFGIGQTVTSGIVSALGRGGLSADGYEDFIQTDASINPGNSGGALVDLNGQLVGINSAIIAPSGGNVGIGFAVPSNMASSVVNQLLEYGEVRRGRLGVTISDLTPDLSDGLGLDIKQGAVVREVDADSPADQAGLQPGDVIVEFDGGSVEGSSDLRNKVGLLRLGSKVEIAYIREGRRQTVEATIGAAPDLTTASGETIDKLQGAEFRTLAPGDPQYSRLEGVLVARVEPGSRADSNGLRAGDIITAVNNRWQVQNLQELSNIIRQTQGTFALNVLRDNRRLFLVIR